MKTNRVLVGILQIILVLSLGTTAIAYVLDDGYVPKGDGKVTIVASLDQTGAETPQWAQSQIIDIADLGTNLALGKTVTADGFNDVYEPKNVNDGMYQTYWEGKVNLYPNIITMDLGSVQKVSKIRVALNPEKVWGRRVQNFSVSVGTDGNSFREAAAAKDYQFDPKTGNMVVVDINQADVDQADGIRFIRLEFTRNTGASAAQIAEFEVYGAN